MLRWFLYDDSPRNAREVSQTTEEAKEPQGAPGSGGIGTGGAELKPEFDDLDPAVTAAILAQVSEVTNVCGYMLVTLIDKSLKTIDYMLVRRVRGARLPICLVLS